MIMILVSIMSSCLNNNDCHFQLGRRLLCSSPTVPKAAVLGSRLGRVARRAKCLPVCPVPEQSHVAFVRLDVVDVGCCRSAPASLAMQAQRVLGQKTSTGLLPLVAVPAGAGSLPWLLADVALGLLRMRITIAVSVAVKPAAARGSTRPLRSYWHGVPSK